MPFPEKLAGIASLVGLWSSSIAAAYAAGGIAVAVASAFALFWTAFRRAPNHRTSKRTTRLHFELSSAAP